MVVRMVPYRTIIPLALLPASFCRIYAGRERNENPRPLDTTYEYLLLFTLE
jgi:hypothetical protein